MRKRFSKFLYSFLILAAFLSVGIHTALTNSPTLYDYYGGKLPSISERAITAAQYGIFSYTGSRSQNIDLLRILKTVDGTNGELGYSVVTNYRTTLSASMTSSQTTIPVSSIATRDGHTLTMSDLGSAVYLVIEPGASKEEIIKCTTISGSSWATCTRGLAFYGSSTASVPANQKAHNSGATVVMSNVHFVYEELVDKDATETIAGVKTFSSSPIIPTPTSSDLTYAANVAYVNNTAYAGAPNGSTTVKGIFEEATQAEIDASTATGATGARLVTNPANLATSIYYVQLPSATEKAALAGTSGTPSVSNKYVTNDDTATAATASKLVRRTASGDITVNAVPTLSTDAASKGYVDGLVSIPMQKIPYYNGTDTGSPKIRTGSTSDGATMVQAYISTSSTVITLNRYTKLSSTGQYIMTHSTTYTPGGSITKHSVAVVGNYAYLIVVDAGGEKIRRYDIADLANVTTITISGTGFTDGTASFGDGTNLYIYTSSSVFSKYSISGTTVTFVDAITFTSSGVASNGGAASDGSNVWIAEQTGTSIILRKYAFTGGAALATGSTYIINSSGVPNGDGGNKRFFMYKSGIIGAAYGYTMETNAAVVGAAMDINYFSAP